MSGSAYVVDLDERAVMRIRVADAPEELRTQDDNRLRRDGEVLPLHDLEQVRLGVNAMFVLSEVAAPASVVVTFRQTSPVVAVELLDEHPITPPTGLARPPVTGCQQSTRVDEETS
ncbi:hypothetical protein [Nocardioides sp.]|uniref:hypothetical protein n=1 Tax=Nocardioides sp. TaxID=35761 RepID=UPI003513EFDB